MHLIYSLCFMLFALNVFGQKFLQIERLHSPKTIKFQAGNEITFQTADGQWYTRVIEDVNYENEWVMFPDGHTPISDIRAIKTFKNKQWSKGLGNKLMLFAPVWGAYKGIAKAVDSSEPIGKPDYIIMGSSLLTGALLRIIFKSKTYKFSRKYRLRILDLNLK